MESYEGFGAVLFVLVLLGAVLMLLKRRGIASFTMPLAGQRSRAARQMEVIERVVLGPQHSLCLVRIGDSRWLAGTSPAGCELRPFDGDKAR